MSSIRLGGQDFSMETVAEKQTVDELSVGGGILACA